VFGGVVNSRMLYDGATGEQDWLSFSIVANSTECCSSAMTVHKRTGHNTPRGSFASSIPHQIQGHILGPFLRCSVPHKTACVLLSQSNSLKPNANQGLRSKPNFKQPLKKAARREIIST
jgi:hypothetical protein